MFETEAAKIAIGRLKQAIRARQKIIEDPRTFPDKQIFHAYWLTRERESIDTLKTKLHPEEKPGILRIGVDFDGNVVDLDTWALRIIRRGLGIKIKTGARRAFMYDEYPEIQALGPKGVRFVEQLYSRDWIYEIAKPVAGAIETLEKWRDQGHELYFITARRGHHVQVTFKWLEKNKMGWAKDFFYFRDQDERDRNKFKKTLSLRRRLHLFIEDFPETLRVIWSPYLLGKLVLEADWNRQENLGPQAVLLPSWEKIDNFVQTTSRWHHLLYKTQT